MSLAAAARVTDPFAHSEALGGALDGMLFGAMIGVALGVLVVATAGVGAPLAIAVGGAIAATGGGGLMGEAVGRTIHGPASGMLSIGSPNVLINGLPATMAAASFGNCSQHGPARPVASGVATVLVNGHPIARVGDQLNCAATIMSGSPNVFIAGISKPVMPIGAEVPGWLNATMQAMVVGGALVATAGAAIAYGVAAAVGGMVGGVGGGVVGGIGGREAAAALGYGATGQAIGGAIGGVVGGGLGGFAGGAAGAGLAGAGEEGAVEGGGIGDATEDSPLESTVSSDDTVRILNTGNLRNNDLVLSGHGMASGKTFTVPENTSITVFAPHGASISDKLGNVIETGGDTSQIYSITYQGGDQMPDYLLQPPDGLKIMGDPITVTDTTPLSQLLKPNMGNVKFAACLYDSASPNSVYMYDTRAFIT